MKRRILRASPIYWEHVKGKNLAKRYREGKLSFLLLNQPPLCDVKCRRCFMPPERRALADRADSGALGIKEWKGVLEEGKKAGVLSIEISGEGEPMLSPNTLPIIKHAKSLGILTTLITNGHNINPESLRFLLDEGATLVFSLHTLDEKGYEIDNCTPGTFRLKMKAIEDAAKIFGSSSSHEKGYLVQRLAVHSTLQADNMNEIGRIKRFCRELGMFFSIAPLANTGNALLHPEIRAKCATADIVGLGDNTIIHSATSRALYGREVCGTAAFGMSIGFDGNLLLDAHGGYELGNGLGNVRTHTFAELFSTWRGVVEKLFKETEGFCPVRDEKRFRAFVRRLGH